MAEEMLWFTKVIDGKWTKSLANFPVISEDQILQQLSRGASSVKKTVDEVRSLKSAKSIAFFKDGHVRVLGVCKTEDDSVERPTVIVKATVRASMKQQLYTNYLAVENITGAVLRAYCDCPAGKGGGCNHIAAVFLALEDFKARGLDAIPDAPTCTEQPCRWKDPGGKRTAPASWDEVKVMKHEIGQVKTPRRTMNCLDFDPRHPDDQNVNPEDISQLAQTLKEIEAMLPFCRYAVPLCPVPDVEPQHDPDDNQLGPHPVSIDTIRQACATFKRSLDVTDAEANCIEMETRGQSVSSKWFDHRKFRLTASVLHKVVNMRKSTNPKLFLISKLYQTSRFQSKDMKNGLERETSAAQRYKLQCELVQGVEYTLLETGLRISTEKGFIAASTDRLAVDKSGKVRLVEIKNPGNSWEESDMSVVLQKQSCLYADKSNKSGVRLKKTHNYYSQIQCQLFVYQVEECDFVLCTKHAMHVETIKKDDIFILDMLHKAEEFFDNVFLPEVVYPRVKYNLDPIDLRNY